MKLLLSILIASALGFAQTPPQPLNTVTLPTFLMIGGSYNQFGSPPVAGLFSAIEPESQSIGLLASESLDLLPVKVTNANKQSGYVFTGSVRFGQHKVLLNTEPGGPGFHKSFVLSIGGDVGPAFGSSGTQPSTITVGLSGSATIGAFYRFSQHWALGLAIRALYMPGIVNGSGGWNPVLEPGIVWCK